ncbi:Uncharacterised protein [Atlantibacter hermannii]|nr:Uncharacterised protein [Atlantibacter hermannii]
MALYSFQINYSQPAFHYRKPGFYFLNKHASFVIFRSGSRSVFVAGNPRKDIS